MVLFKYRVYAHKHMFAVCMLNWIKLGVNSNSQRDKQRPVWNVTRINEETGVQTAEQTKYLTKKIWNPPGA